MLQRLLLQRHGMKKNVTISKFISQKGNTKYSSAVQPILNRSYSIFSSKSLTLNNQDENRYNILPLYRLDQTRHMGRKDGHSAFYKTRPPTKKQRKRYFKRKREQYHEKVGKHSKPGSKAGPLREYEAIEKQDLVDKGAGKISRGLLPESMDYHYGDVLIDDLIGNTASLTSAPTPKPLNMRKQYNKYYNLVSGLMNDYNAQLAMISSKNKPDENNTLSNPLPTDKQISLLVRSYRDKHSTKSKPIGIAKSLQFLMSEIKVPTSLFGERTYSALIYCAASPKEARRIMRMMEENGIPPGVYVYSILVDIHAKRGDFRGCDEVISEMRYESIEPSLAAYTSLLAACYKVIDTPTIPQSIKAEAGKLAWERWKELKINDLEPDVMAYGAIIRIMAARGLPEQAINLIEEMQMEDVKPTTLIFTAALRSVARSHANALRFEGGFSKQNKRRESIAAHHGKLTRQIVILAEQAEVKQDDGFISALMVCASTAGDFATTKAIYLASEVRKLEHLRVIGGQEHLKRFYNVNDNDNKNIIEGIDSGIHNLVITEEENDVTNFNEISIKNDVVSIENKSDLKSKRKEGHRDTRKLSALLRANANAVEDRGLGDMWQGSYNKGFLCENSLRLLTARYVPKYVDKSIPGISGTESGLASMIWDDDEDAHLMGKRLRRKKFMGLLEDTEDNNIDDLDPTLYKLFVEDEDILFETQTNQDTELDSYENSFQINGNESGFDPKRAINSSQSNLSQDIATIEKELFDYSDDENESIDLNDTITHDNNITIAPVEGQVSEALETKPDLHFDSSNSLTHIAKANDNELLMQNTLINKEADELDIILHGMPQSRIRKVRQEFKATLGDPSMLRLVPLLRENLPDTISMDWLQNKNINDALIVLDKANVDGLVDIHVLNSMLKVYAKARRIDDALAFFNEQYAVHNIDPPSSSERTIIEMLVSCNQITEALDFKQKIENKGKRLDLLSYGSLIEYFGNNNQIGSAVALIKECKSIHGSPPGEKCLKQIRIKSRQQGLEETLDLESLIGKDPLYWIKKGENELKREYSKKGRRQIQHAANKLLHI